jgi:predicted alpha/beta hydrolase family esterase
MAQLLFIQGGGAGAHDDWDSKLVASLERVLGAEWDIRYPRMPNEADPTFAAWKPAIERHLAELSDGAVLVGHSLGGAMLVNALAERPPAKRIGALVLVAAPFVGEGGWPGEEFTTPADVGARLPKGMPVHVFHGERDETAPSAHARLYGHAIPPAEIHLLPGRDHQLGNDLTEVAAVIRSIR